MDFLRSRSLIAASSEIRSIIDSYHNYWDILAELAQNAVDAIRRDRVERPDRKHFICFQIDHGSRSITIWDNGVGLAKDLVLEALAPGGGDKTNREDEIGEKGVGLTFCIFSSKRFEVVSRSKDGVLHGGVVTGASDWLLNPTGSTVPQYEEAAPSADLYGNTRRLGDVSYPTDTFTKISISNLSYSLNEQRDAREDLFARSAAQWRFILRTRTAIGNTNNLWDSNTDSDIDCYCEFIDNPSANKKVDAQYPELHNLVKNRKLDGVKTAFLAKDTPKQRRKHLKDRAIWATSRSEWNGKDIKVYGVMFPGNKTFDTLSKTTLRIAQSSDPQDDEIEPLFHSGIFLATKGMPTGIEIEPGRGGKYPAYYRRCFFLVEFDGITFDLGRKSMSHWAKKQLQGAVTALFVEFENIAPYQSDEKLQPIEGVVEQESKAEREKRKQEEWVERLRLPDLDLSMIRYRKWPGKQEAGVAAIFHELLGAGCLKNYFPVYAGYGTRYDLSCLYSGEHRKQQLQLTLEFKYGLESIVRDYEDNRKYWQDIDILVAWNADRTKLLASSFVLDEAEEEPYEGITHSLSTDISGVDDIPVILLKNLIEKLKRKE